MTSIESKSNLNSNNSENIDVESNNNNNMIQNQNKSQVDPIKRANELQDFCQEFNLELNRKHKRQKLEMNNEQFIAFKLAIQVSHCCKVF